MVPMKFLAHTAGRRPSIRLSTDRQGGGLGNGDLLDPPSRKTITAATLEGGYEGKIEPKTKNPAST
jgi:hypothetical protein